MGNCVGSNKKLYLDTEVMTQIRQILSDQEIFMLHLMYEDLGSRIVARKINLQNFLLFFHKNGFWGDRLFKQFDVDESDLITQEQFIRGIAKIFKSTQKEKISLLYKFFSKTGQHQQGVFFNEFLTMLYNYPKEDLKQILNDKDFIEFELKKHLIPIQMFRKSQYLESKNRESKAVSTTLTNQTPEKKSHFFQLDDRLESGALHSLIGKDVMRNIKEQYKSNEMVLRLKDGENIYDIKTLNIQQIVKKFAKRIFQEAKVDVKTGRLNFKQFYNWISVHKTLYENYYDGFHNMTWQVNPITHKPKYLQSVCDKKSEAKMMIDSKLVKVKLFLRQFILVVCLEKQEKEPVAIICLEGLAVKKIYEDANGNGISITHRDGIYQEKKIYFKSEALLKEWMEQLKFYKGTTVHERYQIGEKIGTGKFSVVYKCKNIAQKKQYALKQIATYKLQPQAKEAIAHESSIMRIVSHPLLLQFKECILSKTHIYIITELVNGANLFEFVKQYEYLDEYDAAKITQQIIVGIRCLHSFEIVHRDLKPENIMVIMDQESQEVSNIKIIDFGFSNYLSKLNEMKSQDLLAGTPNYIAPEVLKEETITFRIDNFSIGVILYFMLTGTLPFNDYTITDILKNTMEGQYKFSSRSMLSTEAVNLVQLLLKNNPDERISLEDAVEHAWFNILKQPRRQPRKNKTKKFDFGR